MCMAHANRQNKGGVMVVTKWKFIGYCITSENLGVDMYYS